MKVYCESPKACLQKPCSLLFIRQDGVMIVFAVSKGKTGKLFGTVIWKHALRLSLGKYNFI